MGRLTQPTLSIRSGDTVVLETRDVSDGQISPDATSEAIADIDWDRVYPLAGPIRVEDADPGDTLAVAIVELRHAPGGGQRFCPASVSCRRISPTRTYASST